ncbi:MAG: DUF1801 domain-containing protein [Bacteroidota bacterium]
MAELKTKLNDASVEDFLNTIADEKKRKDCLEIVKLMQSVTKAKAKMWGNAIIGFGNHLLKYESGRELDWFYVGFSPRKQNIVLYLNAGNAKNKERLKQLGKHKLSGSCLHINKLEDINTFVLKEMIKATVDNLKSK